MTRVALHPHPLDVVHARELVELAPEIGVLHRFPVRRAPAVLLPAVYPLADTELNVLRIGVDARAARALQRLQRPDDRHQLHAVVGGVRFAAVELARLRAAAQKRAPAAHARIALARAVGVDVDDVVGRFGAGHAFTTFGAGSWYTPRVSTMSFACFPMSA